MKPFLKLNIHTFIHIHTYTNLSKIFSGTLKNILNTLAEVGGKEFTRLVRNVGLDSKLETEHLTIFVPTDDAIASYMTSNRIDTV